MTRILILVGALVAAGLAAFLARGLVGGQNKAVAATNMDLTEIVVASKSLEVGSKIMPGDLKWQGWPKSALDASFITKEAQPQALEDSAEGSVARMPLTAGEPVTSQKVIKADGAGFMAAVLTPGKRAVGVKLSADRGAGGFILPNDRVDVIMTRKLGNSDSGIPAYRAATVMENVRVLAVDQTSQEDGDSKSILGKTATLELSGQQAETLALAEAMGDLSLSLRSLAKGDQAASEGENKRSGFGDDDGDQVVFHRFGIPSQVATTASAKE
ncbi:MAG: Flp pilus assembly protein CpaB [Alphaproteobacteria bacterium]|nr:Flp pilus assembly protein CpaB [Alphaproteobacteria bacterium]